MVVVEIRGISCVDVPGLIMSGTAAVIEPIRREEAAKQHGEQWPSSERSESVTFQDLIKAHPQPPSLDRDALLRCIEECRECAASCTACADACLGEKDLPELVRCIRLCLDCADVCDATGRIVTRQTAPAVRLIRVIVESCAVACLVCAEECQRHAAHHEHCRICEEACRRCKQACDDVLSTTS
jgi:hypothetical protein